MVAGPLVLAWGLVNHAADDGRFEGVAHQDVVNAHAPVAAKAKVAVVPPGVTFFCLREQAVGVMQPQGHQRAQVIVTTKRLVCSTDLGTEHIWWESITDLHPDLPGWSLTLGFGPDYSPMCLSGPAAPALAVWATAAVHGAPWSYDPRLAALLH